MDRRAIDPIVGDGIVLRLLEEHDLPMTRAWRNLLHVRRWFFDSNPVSEEQHQRWFTGYQARHRDYVFIVEEAQQLHREIGQISLLGVDFTTLRAEVGHLMIGDPSARGRRLGTTILKTVTDFGLFDWQLEEIHAFIKPDNVAIRRITSEVGFIELETTGGRIHIVRRRRRASY